MLNRGKFFTTAMASPRFKGCATAAVGQGGHCVKIAFSAFPSKCFQLFWPDF